MPLYNTINNFLIKHISEITFAFVSLIYIFFWRYLFLLLEKIFRSFSQYFFNNRPILGKVLQAVDSFFVFIISALLLIPFMKIMLEKYLEPQLKTPNLTWIVLAALIASYLYYMLFYSKHIHDEK